MTVYRIQQTALCCRCFTLPLSPEELWENYIHWVVVGNKDHADNDIYPPRDEFNRYQIESIEWLVEHLRYIGQRPATFAGYYKPKRKDELIHFYTCDLLNRRTGLCQAYANRHPMCSKYHTCEHPHTCESLHCSCHPIFELGRQYRQDVLERRHCMKKKLKELK